MTTVVRFRAPAGSYALPVEHVTEVRSAAELTPLPEPRAGVAGLMRRAGDALTVLSVLGEPGAHIIVIDEGGLTFGLLVAEVTGVHTVADDQISPPPPGQDRVTVAGVLAADDGLVLLLDSAALRERLTS
ncbi:MAG: purine-binding chemotaxis protein CheW [Actinomycetota bacterium]|nr:purine-binding chemotaxis protein CheW [Actinomycetota bacterium]